MKFSVGSVPSKREFALNMEERINDSYFRGDITGLIRPNEIYNQEEAFELFKIELLELM